MNAPARSFPTPASALPPEARRTSRALFAVAAAFWPAFLLATILEDIIPLPWLSTGVPAFWIPLILLALACGLAAPFFTPWSAGRKFLGALAAGLLFAASYGVVTWIGLTFFDWSN